MSNNGLTANIRAELARSKRTQSDLAVHLGVSRMSLYRRFNGDTDFRINELNLIAEFLGVPVTTLLGEAAA